MLDTVLTFIAGMVAMLLLAYPITAIIEKYEDYKERKNSLLRRISSNEILINDLKKDVDYFYNQLEICKSEHKKEEAKVMCTDGCKVFRQEDDGWIEIVSVDCCKEGKRG